jgi:hypothetical protein
MNTNTGTTTIVVKATGERKTAVYMANRRGNKQYNVDGKFYNDKAFSRLFEVHTAPSNLAWKVHTGELLNEIMNNPGTGILKVPLKVLRSLLIEVGQEAARIDDHRLNKLMIRLAIYTIAQPEHKDYNIKAVNHILSATTKDYTINS